MTIRARQNRSIGKTPKHARQIEKQVHAHKFTSISVTLAQLFTDRGVGFLRVRHPVCESFCDSGPAFIRLALHKGIIFPPVYHVQGWACVGEERSPLEGIGRSNSKSATVLVGKWR